MDDDESAPSDRGPLVRLTTCSDNYEAAALRAVLEANGIYSYVQGENHRAMLGHFGPYIELNVLVGERDLAAAQTVLEGHLPSVVDAASVPEGTPGPTEEELLAPEAQSEIDFRNARDDRRRRRTWILLWVFFLGPGLLLMLLQLLILRR